MNDIIWKPSEDFLQNSNISRFMKKHSIKSYQELIQKCKSDIEWFWNECLQDLDVKWFTPYTKVLDGNLPFANWFLDGKTNITLNCLDKHIGTEIENKNALIWESDEGEVITLTYQELANQTSKFAAALSSLGIKSGDRVGFYLPMIPEMIVAFFACLKIGAVIVPIFSGFGPEPTSIRLSDADTKLLITADGSFRRGKRIEIKKLANEAIKQVDSIEKVIVVKRTGHDIDWQENRDLWWDDLMNQDYQKQETLPLESESESLIIYTSGTTGKPKGTVHTHAGVIAQVAKEVSYTMDCKSNDTFFWVTDIGWMMGPWEIIGTTFCGASLVIFEGAPNYPNPDRLWEIMAKHKVSILGISPTAIRLLKKYGDEYVEKHNLDILRLMGSTGEAWDPESYMWLFEKVGKSKSPIMNISGGTEIMGCHLAPLPIHPLKACSLQGPSLGMDIDIFDEDGNSLKNEVGYLVCKQPAPSMTKGFLNDKQRYLDTYFDKWPEIWNHGDWAYEDEDGFWFLRGRADDVIKVSGHRTGPAEIESALLDHPHISEAAAIGVPHKIKGECIICFVVPDSNINEDQINLDDLRNQVSQKLGKTLTPEEIHIVQALPKTRSAKIVRGTIKKKFLGQDLGNISSIENPEALEFIGE